MIHGYGGGGAVFTKMIKHMSAHYEVITIDLLGMGASGRPDFNLSTYNECLDYFMDSINRWVQLQGIAKDGKFILVGHSYGGYMAVNYALRYGEQIDKLVLLSSIGVQDPPKETAIVENYKQTLDSSMAKYGLTWANDTWNSTWFSPFDLYRVVGSRISKSFIK